MAFSVIKVKKCMYFDFSSVTILGHRDLLAARSVSSHPGF